MDGEESGAEFGVKDAERRSDSNQRECQPHVIKDDAPVGPIAGTATPLR